MTPQIHSAAASIILAAADVASSLIDSGERLGSMSPASILGVGAAIFAALTVLQWRTAEKRHDAFAAEVALERERNHEDMVTVIRNNTEMMASVKQVLARCHVDHKELH
jgi:hypothetical protein